MLGFRDACSERLYWRGASRGKAVAGVFPPVRHLHLRSDGAFPGWRSHAPALAYLFPPMRHAAGRIPRSVLMPIALLQPGNDC